MNPIGLIINITDPVISDQRVGHRNDLALIGRVCQDLLITCHGCVENQLSHSSSPCAEADSFKHGSIFQINQTFHFFDRFYHNSLHHLILHSE